MKREPKLVSLRAAATSGRRFRCHDTLGGTPGTWIEPDTRCLQNFLVNHLISDCWEIEEQRVEITRSELESAIRRAQSDVKLEQATFNRFCRTVDPLVSFFDRLADILGLEKK